MVPGSRRLWIGAALAAPLFVLLRDGHDDFGLVRLLLAQALIFGFAAATGARGARLRWAGTGVLAWGVAALVAGCFSPLTFLWAATSASDSPPRALAAFFIAATAAAAALLPARLSKAESGDPGRSAAMGAALIGAAVLAAASGDEFPLHAVARALGPLQILAVFVLAGSATIPAMLILQPRFAPLEAGFAEVSKNIGVKRLVQGVIALVASAALAAIAPAFLVDQMVAPCPPGTRLVGTGPWARCLAMDPYAAPVNAH